MVAWQHDMKESRQADYNNTKGKTTVRTIDLVKNVLEHVASRKLPTGSIDETRGAEGVLLKLDIEGSEHELLPHLIITGALCEIGAVFYEEHYWGGGIIDEQDDTSFVKFFQGFAQLYDKDSCPTTFLSVEHESYADSEFPLPAFRRKF